MRKLTKATLVLGLTAFATTACVMGATLNEKNAYITASAESTNVVDLEAVNFSVDKVFIRLGTDTEGNFDYTKNGIMFTAKTDKTTYETYEGQIVYGMLVFPYDYLTGGEFTEEVTYEDGVATYNGKEIAFTETDIMIPEGDYYYYSSSIVNMKEKNKARDFVAIPYVKAMGETEVVYDYKTVSTAYDMVEVATTALANGNLSDKITTGLKTAYLGADESAYEAVAGTYISDSEITVTLNADGTLTCYSDIYAYGSGLMTGSYTLYTDGTVDITANDMTMTATYTENSFRLDEEEYTKVDMDALYTKFTSATYRGVLGTSTTYNPDWTFDKASKTFVYGYCSYAGKFELIPISATFGKMNMTWLTAEDYQALGGPQNGVSPYGKGFYTVTAAYYTYDVATNSYVLRISADGCGVGYNHFSDLWQAGTSPINALGKQAFNTFAGAGTASNVTSKVYTDGNAALTLYNDGTKVDTIDHYARVEKDKSEGRVCSFYDGTNLIWATYDSVATSATTGKFFIDMYKYAIAKNYLDYYWVGGGNVGYAQGDMSRFVVGDYTIANGVASISFSYKGQSYAFTLGTSNVALSTYADGENTLVLNADGTATYNGATAIYSLSANNSIVLATLTEEYGVNSALGSGTSLRNFVYGETLVGEYDAENNTITIGSKVLTDIYAEAGQEVYNAFAGKYTDTYEFETDGTFTITNLTEFDGPHNTETQGTYKLTVAGGIILTINGNTVEGTYTIGENGGLCSFTVGNNTYNEVDTDALLAVLKGSYYSEVNDKNKLGQYDFSMEQDNYDDNPDTRALRVQAWGFDFTYELIPITDTFGKVATYCIRTAENNFYFGISAGDIYYTYDKTANIVRLRYSMTSGKMSHDIAGGHYVDLKKSADTYTTATVYATLAGEYTDAVVSKTYTDGTATLVLYNDGVLTHKHENGLYYGGKAKFNGNDVTYNVVASSATTGKFFIDMSDTPIARATAVSNGTASRFVTGDYVVNGDVITITFSYNGTNYTFVYGANA